MALRRQSMPEVETEDTAGRGPARPGKGDAAFRSHLAVYLCVGLFLFTLNLLTSFGDWWFYWPLFFWGWALVIQAVATYGAAAPAHALAVARSLVPGLAGREHAPPRPVRRRTNGAPFAATAFAAVHERIQRLQEIAGEIPAGAVREQALRLGAAAERIAAVMAADRTDAATVTWFNTRLLQPTEELLDRYARLAGRGVPGAEEALRRVEEENLPLLESRFQDLYNQLHRGEIIDLAVASEMLDLAALELPPATARAHAEN